MRWTGTLSQFWAPNTTRPAVATITVPNSLPIAEYSRRLDSATRTAGFTPQRLDLSHDVGFAASTLPLGVSLARGNG